MLLDPVLPLWDPVFFPMLDLVLLALLDPVIRPILDPVLVALLDPASPHFEASDRIVLQIQNKKQEYGLGRLHLSRNRKHAKRGDVRGVRHSKIGWYRGMGGDRGPYPGKEFIIGDSVEVRSVTPCQSDFTRARYPVLNISI